MMKAILFAGAAIAFTGLILFGCSAPTQEAKPVAIARGSEASHAVLVKHRETYFVKVIIRNQSKSVLAFVPNALVVLRPQRSSATPIVSKGDAGLKSSAPPLDEIVFLESGSMIEFYVELEKDFKSQPGTLSVTVESPAESLDQARWGAKVYLPVQDAMKMRGANPTKHHFKCSSMLGEG